MASTTARKADIKPSMPHVVGRQQHQSNVETEAPKDYYKRALTIPLMDHLISEMDTYFDPNNDAVMSSLLCVFPALLVSREENPVQAALQDCADDLPSPQGFDEGLSFGGANGSARNTTYPVAQLKPWKNVTMKFSEHTDSAAYLGTFSITSVECERSFSTLRQRKAHLEKTMTMQ